MYLSKSITLLTCLYATISAKRLDKTCRDANPSMPYDPNTIKTCTYWFDNDGSVTCADMPYTWAITLAGLILWNPSITPSCTNFKIGFSYCVAASSSSSSTRLTSPLAFNTPTTPLIPTSTTPLILPASTPALIAPSPVAPTPVDHTPEAPTPVAPTPVTTPSPIQPGMVKTCTTFHLVLPNDMCKAIALDAGIIFAEFLAWIPSVGAHCMGLWANTYACVGIAPSTAPSTPSSVPSFIPVAIEPVATSAPIVIATPVAIEPSVAVAPTAIATPTPFQHGTVGNCKKFHLVAVGEDCAGIAAEAGISYSHFVEWNPTAGGACTGL